MRILGARLVRVGKGVHTHLYDDARKAHLCRSGFNAGRVKGGSSAVPEVYTAKGDVVTCYRCQKLAAVNIDAGRKAWDSGNKRG